jgi:hypothetical protein
VDVAGWFGAELLNLGIEAIAGLGIGVDALLEFAAVAPAGSAPMPATKAIRPMTSS